MLNIETETISSIRVKPVFFEENIFLLTIELNMENTEQYYRELVGLGGGRQKHLISNILRRCGVPTYAYIPEIESVLGPSGILTDPESIGYDLSETFHT